MDSEDFQYPQVVVLNHPCLPSGCSCSRQQQAKHKCSSSPAQSARSPARPCCTNYLLKGGSRAAQQEAEDSAARHEAAAWKDLKVANHALANELVRLSTHGSKEKQTLQEEVAKLELLVQAQQDKLELLQARLADAEKHKEEAQDRHHARLKEVARRLKEEHVAKEKALLADNEQLLAELVANQQESSQLPVLQEQLDRLGHKLNLEASGRAELWQRCATQEQELQATHEKLLLVTKSLKRAEQQLDRGAKLEQQLASAEEALQAEQVAHSKLQADVAAERNQAALIKSELEQMMGEFTALRARYEQAEQQRASLKLALTDAQAAAADAAVEVRAATTKAERLQQELDLTKSESVSQVSSLRSQATAREERMAAQHTCRMAQLQSELDAQAAAAADREAALVAARKQVELLTGQVESLRQLSDAAGNQIGATQARLEQLQADKEQQEQQLKAQLQATQVQLMQREAELAESTSNAAAGSKAWQLEQARLQEAADKWRKQAVTLQAELEAKHNDAVAASKAHSQEMSKLQVMLDNATAELADTCKQLSAVDAERIAAAKRSSTLLTQWEERDLARDEELSKLRVQVTELLASSNAAASESDSLRQQLKAKDLELEAMTLSLADEQARLGALRAQLGALEEERAGYFESRVKGMQELSAALQAEQQARLEAQLELNRHKKKVAALEAELQQQQTAMNQVLNAKSKAEEAAATSAAALSAAERKAKLYRGDSTALLSDYDAWVQSLLAKKSSSGSGGTPTANGAGAARGTSSLFNSTAGAAATAAAAAAESGSWTGGLQSPIREGGLSRNVSQLASPAGHMVSPGGARDADLERYDRIAALLDNRAGSSLTRSLSGKAPPLSPGPLAASSSSIGSPAAAARNSKVTSTRVSPRPSFR